MLTYDGTYYTYPVDTKTADLGVRDSYLAKRVAGEVFVYDGSLSWAQKELKEAQKYLMDLLGKNPSPLLVTFLEDCTSFGWYSEQYHLDAAVARELEDRPPAPPPPPPGPLEFDRKGELYGEYDPVAGF